MPEPTATLISLTQLLEEIGRPTDLESVPGYVVDSSLQAIIDEVTAAFAEAGLAKAQADGLDGMTVELGEPVAIELSLAGHSTKMAVGEIAEHYFPYVFHAVAPDGTPLAYDEQIDASATAEPWPGTYHRFDVRGREVYVLPKTLDSASFFLPTQAKVVAFVMAGEVPKYNELIITRARKMLASLVKEQSRLEGTLEDKED